MDSLMQRMMYLSSRVSAKDGDRPSGSTRSSSSNTFCRADGLCEEEVSKRVKSTSFVSGLGGKQPFEHHLWTVSADRSRTSRTVLTFSYDDYIGSSLSNLRLWSLGFESPRVG
jgi:hypothetical protein